MTKNSKTKKKKTESSSALDAPLFRPTYRNRCIYSFGRSVEKAYEIHETLKKTGVDPVRLGMHFICFHRYLSNALEMFSKAMLEERSKYLLLDNLSSFGQLEPPELDWDHFTCSAEVALARASKLLKKKLTQPELGRFASVFKLRNGAEHGNFEIGDFEKSLRGVVPVLSKVVDLYDNEYGPHAVKNEAAAFFDEIMPTFETLVAENSSDYLETKNLLKLKEKLGAKFMDCLDCFYPFAEMTSDQSAYRCLWCDNVRQRKKCPNVGCDKYFWASAEIGNAECDGPHLHDFLSKLIANFNVQRGATRSDLEKQNAQLLNLDSSARLDPFSQFRLSPTDGPVFSSVLDKSRNSIIATLEAEGEKRKSEQLAPKKSEKKLK